MTAHPTPARILVIDDDPMSRDLVVLLLEREGCTVEAAESGEAALGLLARGGPAPDLVLTDIQLPGLAGAELARRLRDACGPATLLLAVSGSRPPAGAVSLFDGFLLKPFEIEQVIAALRARHRSPRHASTSKSASKIRMNLEVQTDLAEPAETGLGSASGDVPILNETIYSQLAGSMPAQQLVEMYALCLNDTRRRIARMRGSIAGRDQAQFVREAHAIKGGCGMLGATELHRIAARLETAGLDSSQTADVNSLDELSAACDRLERMLGSRA